MKKSGSQKLVSFNMWQLMVAATTVLMLLQSYTSWTFKLPEILGRCQQELYFETILLLQHSEQLECQQLQQIAVANWSFLRFSQEANNLQLRASQNSQILTLMCLTGQVEQDMQLWQTLAKNLYNMRGSRVILLLPQQQQQYQVRFQELAEISFQLHFPHVLLLANEKAYQLQPYKPNQWLHIPLNNSKQKLFTKQHNFNGHIAYGLPDQMATRSLVYWHEKTQKLEMVGSVARLIQELARRHNITLKLQHGVVAGKQMSLLYLRNMTLAGTLSLPITMIGLETNNENTIFSYPYAQGDWFIMVPCGQVISTANVYPKICNSRLLTLLISVYLVFTLLDFAFGYLLLNKKLNWTYLIFNEHMISGIIGQTCKLSAHCACSSRLAQAQLFLLGLVFGTVFIAQLKTLIYMRPVGQRITNFEDLYKSKLNIYFDDGERFVARRAIEGVPDRPRDYLVPQIIFLEANSFFKERKILNNTSALSMLTIDWEIVNRQQELFSHPAFCFEPNLIIEKCILFAIPLHANSIYAEPLSELIHWVKAAGLSVYWQDEALRSLIALGEISLEELYPNESFHEFKIQDFFWIWFSLFLGLFTAFLTFVCELLVFQLSKKTKKYKTSNVL